MKEDKSYSGVIWEEPLWVKAYPTVWSNYIWEFGDNPHVLHKKRYQWSDVCGKKERKGKMNREIDWVNHNDRAELEVAYKTLSKASGFKVGDKVKVLRKFEPFELGCLCGTRPPKRYIGLVGTIVNISAPGRFRVAFRVEPFFHF